MRMDTHGARGWLTGLAVMLAMVSGTAGAAVLGNPYALRGYEWGNDWIRYADGGNGSLLVATNRSDLETATISRYGSDGQLLGSHSMPSQGNAIASNRVGNYVVANVTAQGVYATVFNRNGVAIVARFQASTRGGFVRVAMNESGMFVLTYLASAPQPNGSTNSLVYARVFNRDGTPRTGELLISNGDFSVAANSTALAMDGYGNFVLNLLRIPGPRQGEHRLLRFSRDGVLLDSYNDVTDAAGNGENAGESINLTANSAGQFIFGWTGMNLSLTQRLSSTRFQRFAANGQKLGPIVLLGKDPPDTTGYGLSYGEAQMGLANDGRYVAVWSQRSSPTDGYAQWNIFAREYRADGTPLTDVFRIDTAPATATVYTDSMRVLMSADGQYTVVWAETDAGQYRQWARRFRMEGGPPAPVLNRGVPVGGLSGALNSFQYFRFTVPPNTPSFTVTLSGGGDADMFIRYGEPPTLASYDFATGIPGSDEGAMVNNPPPGDFYVGLFGYSAYSGVSLQADW